eukprot:NODE_55_length_1873_cov_108.494518_g35_i0.p1 GENE.NODE_55_length_1873_cov_108.494518_g35_i0~~NODE_55_length_1873_cov_108.494518_g35_i0.p1  ORF type:complete len:548 (-),score=152.68 NODE_55_length_1873_cov_108.494518_g35_i0:170-1813(-)
MRWLLLCLVGFAAAFVAEPELPAPWKRGAVPHESRTVDLVIVLKQRNRARLAAVAGAVSNPQSAQYGQYLTQKEIAALVAPDAAVVASITQWLKESGASFTVGPNGDMVEVQWTVKAAELALQTTIVEVTNLETKQSALRASALHLPPTVAPHVHTVLGAHGLPLPPRKTLESAVPVPYKVDPTVLASQYKITGVTASGNTNNRQAVAEFQGQLMSGASLKSFFKKFVPNAKTGDDMVYKFVGTDAGKNGTGIEALLDIEYIMGVAPGLKSEFWEFPAQQFCMDLVKWTQTIATQGADAPHVHSVSYGWQGDLKQVGCAAGDVDTVDAEFQKLAAAGITLVIASGDSGSGYSGGKIWPSWPASSPWVTAVGGTRFVSNTPGAEMATDQFGSGGGFSSMFDAATYQSKAVANYFTVEPASKLPPASMYNKTGRATPDVSALGEGYQVVVGTRTMSVGGTSASTPAFAGMISLINDARIAKGGKALGFLNPWLYQNQDAFTDVTVGNNRIGRGGNKLAEGWDCVTGWDPATGMGTPVFSKLLAAAVKDL